MHLFVCRVTIDNGAIGIQLWESDGTNAGTKMYTVNPTGSAFPSGMNLFNGKLLFAAFDRLGWTNETATAGEPGA